MMTYVPEAVVCADPTSLVATVWPRRKLLRADAGNAEAAAKPSAASTVAGTMR